MLSNSCEETLQREKLNEELSGVLESEPFMSLRAPSWFPSSSISLASSH